MGLSSGIQKQKEKLLTTQENFLVTFSKWKTCPTKTPKLSHRKFSGLIVSPILQFARMLVLFFSGCKLCLFLCCWCSWTVSLLFISALCCLLFVWMFCFLSSNSSWKFLFLVSLSFKLWVGLLFCLFAGIGILISMSLSFVASYKKKEEKFRFRTRHIYYIFDQKIEKLFRKFCVSK